MQVRTHYHYYLLAFSYIVSYYTTKDDWTLTSVDIFTAILTILFFKPLDNCRALNHQASQAQAPQPPSNPQLSSYGSHTASAALPPEHPAKPADPRILMTNASFGSAGT